tara:strand:+ start:1286 stop:1972 length:687 start_codon:yes stop_codon:yes gene_type:complete
MKKELEFRKPTKQDSLFMLKEAGLNPKTIFDIGGGREGTSSLADNFKDSKHVIFEPKRECGESITAKYADKVNDFELVFEALGNSWLNSLDYFVKNKNYDDPYLIKIDVDGNDYVVLQGCAALLSKTDCVIVESNIFRFFMPEQHAYRNRDVAGFITLLEDHNFFLFDITDPLYIDGFLNTVDLIFCNKDSFDIKTIRPDWNKRGNQKAQRIFYENNYPSEELIKNVT